MVGSIGGPEVWGNTGLGPLDTAVLLPDTDYLKWLFPTSMRSNLYRICYSPWGQEFSICNYWHDPHHDDLYLNASSFLALINGERDHPNATGETLGSYLGPVFCLSDPLCFPLQPGPTPVTDSSSFFPFFSMEEELSSCGPSGADWGP